ncbi:MAG: 3-phosphoshikimate 1-carboxyvinyltransferase [Micavibrio aeruginosavorus]|uniref:3-phosphoshikimate 1-carboxyvinyltransferase n=1 Tax=Micavibrio aeruginosavorus TaxID=349221 RepID=A0A7T5R295_9BACT|nr:MAG: 3-phosphoshikimate 1-carboxyvinyltransferase [Micavibrio aeruginosavorus]
MTLATPLISRKSGPLTGTTKIPGDKSISHRSLMFGALAEGETMISGLLEGEDVMNTAAAMRALGARIIDDSDGLWRVQGIGIGNLKEPTDILDMGNSGTSTRLLLGICASHELNAIFTGDKSLIKRPMKRVMEPLTRMGAQFLSRDGGRLPLAIKGTAAAKGIEYTLPVASAQVKSAILLAGLNAQGTTTVIERHATRDHSENMLRHFGVDVDIAKAPEGEAISVRGGAKLLGCAVDVPGDPSSGAFPAVAACIVPDSAIRLQRICVNPRRDGIYKTLKEMGADITYVKVETDAGEPVTDIVIRYNGALKGIDVPPERVPSMIDEFPVLAMAAACANGVTRMTNLAELRIKESDRLKMIADGLIACGVKLEMDEDSLTVYGNGKPPRGGALIETALDHRIAMSFLVLGLVSDEPLQIDDGAPIRTSFPNFIKLMNECGGMIEAAEPKAA